MQQTIITITGPSCSGKSTLAEYLSNHGIPEVQSFTTRERRPSEKRAFEPDSPYRYVDLDWVNTLHPDDVIECVQFNGNWYGNTKFQLHRALSKGRGIATVVVEPKGVKHWAVAAPKYGFRHFSIYLSQTKAVLTRRFVERLKSATDASIDYELQRMRNMLEVEHSVWPAAHDYDLIVRALGDSSTMSGGVTMEMILGFIKLSMMPGYVRTPAPKLGSADSTLIRN